MILIIHIGAPKTGSTAIQSKLNRNTSELADQGILAYSENFDLAMRYCSDSYFPGPMRLRFANRQEAGDWSEANWQAFETRVRKERPEVTILSSEFLISMIDTQPMRERVLPLFDRVLTVGYLRDPLSHFPSHIDQSIRGGTQSDGINVSKSSQRNFLLKGLWSYVDTFGQDSMTIRNFDRSNLKDGDVVADFLSVVSAMCGRTVEAPNQELNTNSGLCGAVSAWLLEQNDAQSQTRAHWESKDLIRQRWRMISALRTAPELKSMPRLKLEQGPLRDAVLGWSTPASKKLNAAFFVDQVPFTTATDSQSNLDKGAADAAFRDWIRSYLTSEARDRIGQVLGRLAKEQAAE